MQKIEFSLTNFLLMFVIMLLILITNKLYDINSELYYINQGVTTITANTYQTSLTLARTQNNWTAEEYKKTKMLFENLFKISKQN